MNETSTEVTVRDAYQYADAAIRAAERKEDT